jgi:hypothetical protein
MTYQVAIQSYKRSETLPRLTLPLLHDRKVPANRITVFVADEQEAAAYHKTLPRHMYGEIVIGVPGCGASRNFVNDYYPEGTHLVCADDDLRDVIGRVNPQTARPVLDLDGLFREMFDTMRALNLALWGVYPVRNPYFMSPTLTTDLRYIVAALMGVYVEHKPHAHVTMDDKEDFERSIKHYLYAGGVLRRNDVAIDTRYYKEPGGMQVERTPERVAASAYALLERYPHLCTLNTSKRSHYTEIKLKDRRRPRVPPIPLAEGAA